MGAWGTAPWENDGAADWFDDLFAKTSLASPSCSLIRPRVSPVISGIAHWVSWPHDGRPDAVSAPAADVRGLDQPTPTRRHRLPTRREPRTEGTAQGQGVPVDRRPAEAEPGQSKRDSVVP